MPSYMLTLGTPQYMIAEDSGVYLTTDGSDPGSGGQRPPLLVNEYVGAKTDNAGGTIAIPFVPTAGNRLVVVSALTDGSVDWTTNGWTSLADVAASGGDPAIHVRHKVSAGNETSLDFQLGTNSWRQFNWWFAEFASAAEPVVSAIELNLAANGFPPLVVPSPSLVTALAFASEGRAEIGWSGPFNKMFWTMNPRDGGTRPTSDFGRIASAVEASTVQAVATGWQSATYRGFVIAVPGA